MYVEKYWLHSKMLHRCINVSYRPQEEKRFVEEPVGKDQVIPREPLFSESPRIKEPNL